MMKLSYSRSFYDNLQADTSEDDEIVIERAVDWWNERLQTQRIIKLVFI